MFFFITCFFLDKKIRCNVKNVRVEQRKICKNIFVISRMLKITNNSLPRRFICLLWTATLSCSHVLWTLHFSLKTFLTSKSRKCHFWQLFSNKNILLTIGNEFLCAFLEASENEIFEHMSGCWVGVESFHRTGIAF